MICWIMAQKGTGITYLDFQVFLAGGSPCSVVGQISVTFASLVKCFVGSICLFLCRSCQGRKISLCAMSHWLYLEFKGNLESK